MTEGEKRAPISISVKQSTDRSLRYIKIITGDNLGEIVDKAVSEYWETHKMGDQLKEIVGEAMEGLPQTKDLK